MVDAEQAEEPQEWWREKAPQIRSFFDLKSGVVERLRRAVSSFGYARPEEAEAELGAEIWLSLLRSVPSWEDFCAASTDEELEEVGARVASHLTKVRSGKLPPLSKSMLGGRDPNVLRHLTRLRGQLTPIGAILQGSPTDAVDYIKGKELMLHLASLLNNDAQMTPIGEIQFTSASKERATRITKELLELWEKDTDRSLIRKQQFRRTLARRLRENG